MGVVPAAKGRSLMRTYNENSTQPGSPGKALLAEVALGPRYAYKELI